MKKILNLLLLLLFVSITSLAKETEGKKEIKAELPAYKAILLGDDRGRVYYSENIDKMHPLASVTKVMTIMVAFDEIDKGTVKLTDKVKVSKKAAETGGSRIAMKEGNIYTLEDLIKATAIYSANNAAYAIAEHISKGNVDNFIKKMNKKAEEIGAKKELKFCTPNGLPSHMTKKGMDEGTAKGVYMMSMAAEKYEKYMEIASMKEAEIGNGNSGKMKIKNRNQLLGEEGIYGIKTGNHSKAGYNIAIVADKDDIKTFTVVMGSPSVKIRDENVLKQMEEFYENYNYRKITDKNIALAKISVFSGEKDYVEVYPDQEYKEIVPKDSNIQISIKRNKTVIAPVEIGKELGDYKILIDGNVVQEGKLVTKEEIKLSIPFKKYFN